MEEDKIAVVNVATEVKIINVAYAAGWTAEDLCIKICQQFGIGPVARHLFALRNRERSTKHWYHSGHKFDGKEKHKFDFRLRFKPSSLQRLKQIDVRAYDYYFLQAKNDVLENKVQDIVYEKHKRELIGLGVCDMYRVMLEKEVPREIVESDYKKYIPKECIKRHSFFIKKPIHNALARISGHDASFVKEQYLNQFETMAPNYLCEEFKALMDNNNQPIRVLLKISVTEIKYCQVDDNNNNWKTLCAIEDLCFISIRQDHTVEVSRKNGIPSYLKFSSHSLLMSFVSGLDGYYRLSIKWTFNLCGDAVTPSLEHLHRLKCHGPVGGEFSYSKLEDKRANKPGTFILRESEFKYDVYYLDVCGKDFKPRTRKIEKRGHEDFVLPDSMERFKSIPHLVAAHQDPENSLYLKECLPPSEYDKSPLLICAPEGLGSDVAADEEIIAGILEGRPYCVSPLELQMYKTTPFPKSKESQARISSSCSDPITLLYKAKWKVIKGKRLDTAYKLLQGQNTKEFLKLTQNWSKLRSSAVVRLYGLTLVPLGMLLELVKLGPLDVYLQNNSPQTIKTVDMVEAAACLATAVWHLEEHSVVHGNIRCRKLLVHAHTDNSFIVKLADPGIFSYTASDIHWVPPEKYTESNNITMQFDLWAVGTTLWEIFSRGAVLPPPNDVEAMKEFYKSGKRLPIPSECPPEIYKLMTECWGEKEGSRKRPQAIMRDINQIKYQVYNSRRSHAYDAIRAKRINDSELLDDDISEVTEHNSSSDCESRASSIFTDRTSLPWDDSEDNTGAFTPPDCSGIPSQDMDGAWSVFKFWKNNGNRYDNDDSLLEQMQDIFELDADCNVILQGRIGQGFYGEVYQGTLERGSGKDAEPQQVAVKKLKMRALEADVRDFEREIDIMKTLKHPNVVEILGVISEPEVCLVMEFVKHGSLQSYLAIHRESLTHRRLLGFSLDIATGMDYLGRKSIVHRDLAARNILVADDTRVKISDFGLAQVTGKNNDYYMLQTNRDLPIKWYAPESLRDGKFSPRSDVWSFGVTMYETFTFGEDPKLPEFCHNNENYNKESEKGNNTMKEEGSAELLKALESGARLPCPLKCPQEVYVKIMYPCWHIHSQQRPDFAKLCKDIRDLINNLC